MLEAAIPKVWSHRLYVLAWTLALWCGLLSHGFSAHFGAWNLIPTFDQSTTSHSLSQWQNNNSLKTNPPSKQWALQIKKTQQHKFLAITWQEGVFVLFFLPECFYALHQTLQHWLVQQLFIAHGIFGIISFHKHLGTALACSHLFSISYSAAMKILS